MSDRSWNAQRSRRRAATKEKAETMSKSELVALTVHLHKATPKAVLVSDDGDEDGASWLPLSQIVVDESAEEGETTEISVPEWLAQREGLI